MKKPIEYLKSGELKVGFRWVNRPTKAEIYYKKKKITFNIPCILAAYFVHELMHYVHPDIENEKKIEAMDEYYFNKKMRVQEVRELGRALFKEMMRYIRKHKQSKRKKKCAKKSNACRKR